MYENFFLVCKRNACKDMYFFSKNVNARHKSDLSTKVINIICVVFEKKFFLIKTNILMIIDC